MSGSFVTFADATIVMALGAGGIRAVFLWRAFTRVDVVNVAVLGTLSRGRAQDLAALLAGVGPALYPRVVSAVCEPVQKLMSGSDAEVRARLDHDGTQALILAHRQLRRSAWLDGVTVGGMALCGISVLVGSAPGAAPAGGLVAATLLWLANVRAARHIATGMHAGVAALVDSLMAALEPIRKSHTGA